MKKKTILIVEDDESNRILIRDILNELGMETIEAENAEKGIETARAAPPDLIILDYKLAGINGIEAAKILKSDAATSRIPIAIVTASVFKKDKEKAIEAGCDAFVIKPIKFDEFIETVNKLLGIPGT